MNRIYLLLLAVVLAAFLGPLAGAQQAPSQPATAAAVRQSDPQSKPAAPTPSPEDLAEGASKTARPTERPVLRSANRDLVEQQSASESSGPEDVGEGDVVRVETTLISIPVSVMDRDGKYIANLRQQDFRIWENGVEQQVAYFATTEKPFTVVLMIDTSGSTRMKLQAIQNAAIAFVEQLRPDDRVAIVSFSDKIKILAHPTSDRQTLRTAIQQTEPGDGTRLFDAVSQVVLKELPGIEGRKAIVLFTDGVDTTSKRATYYETVRAVEESGALVYPIKYSTYSDLDFLRPTGGPPISTARGARNAGNSPAEYERGDRYLRDLGRVSGARVYDAAQHTLSEAFHLVAEELRRQYSVGYYPSIIPRPGDSRKIKVRVNRPELVVRTRDSYVFRPRPGGAPRSPNSQSKLPD